MAFEGYLIKVGNYEIPMEFMLASSYDVTRQVMEARAWRDSQGKLHRQTVDHVPVKINFKTPGKITNHETWPVLKSISDNFTNKLQRMASVTCYVPETDSYITQDMYMPDLTMTIDRIEGNTVIYESIKITFIGY